jgi:outer membrane protein OmpA-like peptidoglycan-associated protein
MIEADKGAVAKNKLLVMRLLFFLSPFLLQLSFDALAISYGAPATESKWDVISTRVECRLSHEIPGYGVASFLQQAGKPLSFSLLPRRESSAITRASLKSLAPTWMHQPVSGQPHAVYLEKTTRFGGVVRLAVREQVAETMLTELGSGRFPTFIYLTKPTSIESTETHVAVSSVNFMAAFESFSGCRNELLPFSLEEIQSQYLFFAPSSSQVSREIKDEMSMVAGYLAAMEGSSVMISSYSRGGSKKAQKLFKQRVAALNSVLTAKGIKTGRIKSLFKRPSTRRDSRQIQLLLVDPSTLKLLHYRVNSAAINDREKEQLRLLVSYIKDKLSGVKVVVNGHTDSQGSREKNLKLSKKRAEVVSRFLQSAGVPAKKVRTKAWGERKPVSSNRSSRGRSNNRRVKIDLVD